MVKIEPTIFCKNFDVILTRKDLKQIKRESAKKKDFWTIKKWKSNCVFLKGNSCTLKENAPLLCRVFPLFFKIEKEEHLVVWLSLSKSKRKICGKKLEEKKKIAFEFLKEASRKELRVYLNLLKLLKLEEIEEEILPKEIIKIIRRKI